MIAQGRITLSVWFESVYRPERLLGCSPGSLADYRSTLRQLAAWHGRDPWLDELTTDLVCGFIEHKSQAEKLSPYTCNKHLGTLLAFWRHAAASPRRDLDPPPPIKPLPEPRLAPAAWTLEEFGRLLTAAASLRGTIGDLPASDWWLSLLLAIYDTGSRIGAMLEARCDDLLLDRKVLILRKTKQRAEQVQGISEQTVSALHRLRPWGRESVWPWPYDLDRQHLVTLHRHRRRLLKAAGLPVTDKHGFHRIRRTTTTQAAIRGGVDAAARLVGHSSSAITRRHYLDVSQLAPPSADEMLARPSWSGPEVQRELF